MGRWTLVAVVALSLGCTGLWGEPADEPVEVPVEEEPPEEGDGEEEGDDDDDVDDILDTAEPEEDEGDDDDPEGGDGRKGEGKKRKPAEDAPAKKKPEEGGKKSKTICLAASAPEVTLRIDLEGAQVVDGQVALRDKGKGNVQAQHLEGKRENKKITAKGKGKVDGEPGEVSVVLSKEGEKVVLKINGQSIPKIKKTPCSS